MKDEDRLAGIVRSIETRGPRPGDRFRHYKGGEYEVVDSAIQENPLAHVVVYRNLAEGHLWVRPIDDWLATVQVDGRAVPRFERLGPATSATAPR